MSDRAVRVVDGIAALRLQEWPKWRGRTDTYRALARAEADQVPRVVICAFCEKRSRPLAGPAARAWWANHKCRPSHLRVVQ